MKKSLFFTLPLILFSCGQQSNNPMTEEQKGRIIEEIKPLITQLWESNEQLNFEKFLEQYWIKDEIGICKIINTLIQTNN